MGEVERRALYEADPAESPLLGDVLSRYAGAISAKSAATPLRKARRK
jgi:hypothetical protein